MFHHVIIVTYVYIYYFLKYQKKKKNPLELGEFCYCGGMESCEKWKILGSKCWCVLLIIYKNTKSKNHMIIDFGYKHVLIMWPSRLRALLYHAYYFFRGSRLDLVSSGTRPKLSHFFTKFWLVTNSTVFSL